MKRAKEPGPVWRGFDRVLQRYYVRCDRCERRVGDFVGEKEAIARANSHSLRHEAEDWVDTQVPHSHDQDGGA